MIVSTSEFNTKVTKTKNGIQHFMKFSRQLLRMTNPEINFPGIFMLPAPGILYPARISVGPVRVRKERLAESFCLADGAIPRYRSCRLSPCEYFLRAAAANFSPDSPANSPLSEELH
jgi:hypothetical protein